MNKNSLQCGLCPKHCIVEPGQSGECRIRVNLDGKLTAVTYGYPCSVHLDPIEKKPLFHMLPGTSILSIATVGCNLHCKNCQNWQISQCDPENSTAGYLPPEKIPPLAKKQGCGSVAYTYTEPIVYYEYALNSSIKTHAAGLKNVLVTAAYVNKKPWRELCRHTDAANVDLKAMSDRFYREICDATLKPVLDALLIAKEEKVMVEITNLIIPSLNDSDRDLLELSRWIKTNMGAETPLHFSRFFPQYKMKHLPPTPSATLTKARQIALSEGLKYVYIGNILSDDGENTTCPGCGNLLIERERYLVKKNNLNNGQCRFCREDIPGIWK